jgi:O-antigen/teichoic acid export membrane protein
MKKLVCPHCDSHVSERANVCVGCGAEIVRGATRRERTNFGCIFSILGLIVGLFIIGAMLPRKPNDDAFLFVFLGLIAFVIVASFVGQGVARVFHRSKLRFLRGYEHQ